MGMPNLFHCCLKYEVFVTLLTMESPSVQGFYKSLSTISLIYFHFINCQYSLNIFTLRIK